MNLNQTHRGILQKLLTKSSPKFIIEEFLFKEQLALARDPARFATAVCSVRAGKTYTCAADMIHTCIEKPGIISIYITLARSSAKRIIWPDLHKLNREYRLNGTFNESELSIKFQNGSIIYCSGASDSTEIEKFRGLSNVELVYIDESQAFRSHIKELVEEIIIKRLYDTNGRLRLIGTPGPIPTGYFYDACHSDKWSHHAWTLHSNPWIEKKSGMTVQSLIQQDCDRKGVDINDPSIQRECFGRWVLDTSSLLLNYNPNLNHYEQLPSGAFTYILGMDFGFDDADSFSVLGWHESSPNTYLVEELIAEKQTFEQMEANFKILNDKYPLSYVEADPGGGGKKLIESLKQRYRIPFNAADKTEKIANYGLLNNALRTGKFLAKKDSRFAQDCNLIEKDRDKSTPDKTVVKGHSDAIDSCFVSGTLIHTDKGLKRIEEVDTNDRVLTREGFQPVAYAFCSGEQEVSEYFFSNNVSVICTKEHPFLTYNGFVRADALLYGNECVIHAEWQKGKPLSSMEGNFTDTLNPIDFTPGPIITDTSDRRKESHSFMSQFGNFITDLFQKACIFIIKIITRIITIFRIFNACLRKITIKFTQTVKMLFTEQKLPGLIWIESDHSQKNGMRLKKVRNGIFSTVLDGGKKTGSVFLLFARFAKKLISGMCYPNHRSFIAQENAELEPEENLAKMILNTNAKDVQKYLKIADSNPEYSVATLVQRTLRTKKEKVYNLTVNNKPEYFANGFLVHNCLYPFRKSPAYGFIPLPKAPKRGTPEFDRAEEDKIYSHNLERIKKEQEQRDNQGQKNWESDPMGVPSWNQW